MLILLYSIPAQLSKMSRVPDIMAPAYKITYFPIKGLTESIRFLFSYGGIEFEDIRIKKDDWAAHKPNVPFGQLPVLEHNGKKVNQSTAIARYVAKQVKLTGKNDWEDLEIDAIVDTLNDLGSKIALYAFEEDKAVKESRKEALFNETLPFYLTRLEKVAKENKGHLAVGRLTWADLYFASRFESFTKFTEKDLLADYPNLRAVNDTVLALPAIKAWIAKRPEDNY